MDWTIISIAVTAIATCFIAYYSYISACLTNELKNQDKSYRDRLESFTNQHQSELSDLYQAIVIATLIGGHSSAEETIKRFKKLYSGTVKIFKSDGAEN